MDKRTMAMVGLGAAALLILITLLTKGWLTAGEGKVSIGMNPYGTAKVCMGDKCESHTAKISKAKGKGKVALVFGKIGFVVGFLAVLCLIGGAVTLAMKNENAAKVCLASLALTAFTAFCMLMFILLIDKKDASIGWGTYLFFLGAAAGIGGGVVSRDVEG